MFLIYIVYYHGLPNSNDRVNQKAMIDYVLLNLKKILEKLNDNMWITEIHYIATFLHPEIKSLAVSIIY
jgi:hypothetical protein